MGNTVSCCVSPESSPKLPSRQPAERLEEFQTSTEVSDDNTVPYLQHISDREVPDGRWYWAHLCWLDNWLSFPVFELLQRHTHVCLFTGRFHLYPAIVKNLLHLTPKRTSANIHFTCGYTHPVPLMRPHKQVQFLVQQQAATWWYTLSQLQGNTPGDTCFSYCQPARLVYCHLAASSALMMVMMTFLAWFSRALHHVDHTGVTLPSQTLTMKTNPSSSWCHINHSEISNKNKPFIIIVFYHPQFCFHGLLLGGVVEK